MTEEQERAAFDAWVGPVRSLPKWSPLTCAWMAWKARAALSQSTPDPLPHHEHSWRSAQNQPNVPREVCECGAMRSGEAIRLSEQQETR